MTLKEFRAVMERKCVSQRELAQAAGISEVSMSRWMNGEKGLPVEKLNSMITFLKLMPDRVLPSVRVVLDEGAFAPVRAHSCDAGLDIKSPLMAHIPAKGSVTIDTGVHIEIPAGYVGFLKSKSGLNVKSGITSEGVIDSGYTGSVRVKLYNNSDTPYDVLRGDKITQLVILPVYLYDVQVVDAIWEESERGDGGFGSTGR